MPSKLSKYSYFGSFVVSAALLSGCGGNSIEELKLSANPAMTGAPINMPTFLGPRSNYFIVKNANDYSVQDVVGSEGLKRIPLVEKIKFSDVTLTLNMSETISKIGSGDYKNLIELYIAFFNRLPDAEGLSYWISRFKDGMSIDDIANSFYNAGLQYSDLSGYTSNMTNEDFVKIIYKNVLGRSEVDQEGLAYWSKSLANGSETRGTLIRTILNSAHTFKGDPVWGRVADLLDNKFIVANNFANFGGVTFNSPSESISNGMAILALVTAEDTSKAMKLVDERAANTRTPVGTNTPPIAKTGTHQNVVMGSVITLNGAASTDSDGDKLTYSWMLDSKPEGSKAFLIQPTSVVSTFTADLVGEYVVTLTVSDGKSNHSATTKVSATAAPTPLLTVSPYITYPVDLDRTFRLTNATAALATLADESAFRASPSNDAGWKMQATYARQGLFKVPVTQGYFYQFSSSSYWGPCMQIYDEAGYSFGLSLGLSCAPSSSTTSSIFRRLLVAKSGYLYVDVTSRTSPVFKNADLVIEVNTDSKGIDGGQQIDLSTFATGQYAEYIDFGFYGGSGNDKIVGKTKGNNMIYAGAGNDLIEIKPYQYNSSFVDGGPGTDTLVVGFSSSGIALKKVAAFGYGRYSPGSLTDSLLLIDKSIVIRDVEYIQFTDKILDVNVIPVK
ncbi:DUF4214 domain-containing protein [Undibacterium amnicola]|uniref:DUF4214 domain-containing protein n=1 Tax=Undibacterium amnicola TaxID=1834038 RepID=A0ABR6XPN5_9BURK|nr:DUF4214 domain-containing protein [Undibacterium amnicola]MBC3831463.1 DUF4214 domain-containing protein [Undibacterium amnicola]